MLSFGHKLHYSPLTHDKLRQRKSVIISSARQYIAAKTNYLLNISLIVPIEPSKEEAS